MTNAAAVGLFGGTFDPVHIGHLRIALELKRLLNLDEMRLVPCADPAHRASPLSSSQHRLAMLQSAVEAAEAGLVVDDRELQRAGPTYTIDTLISVRQEVGPQVPVFFCVGMDSLVNLADWQRWQELTDYANFVVTARPGWQQPQQGPVAELLERSREMDLTRLQKSVAGKVYITEMTLLPISSSIIREDLRQGLLPTFLVPHGVIDYITRHQLYQGER